MGLSEKEVKCVECGGEMVCKVTDVPYYCPHCKAGGTLYVDE